MTSQPKPYSDPTSTPFILKPLSPESIERMTEILDEWMADDSGYDEETWTELEAALNHKAL
jgi:hypothetical protein